MDWSIVNSFQIHNTLASLGVHVGDTYYVSKDCLPALCLILKKLKFEDKNHHTFRRALGSSQAIKKDLLPVLINVKDDYQILDTIVRILTDLTTPAECLLHVNVWSKTDAGRHTLFEINQLLISSKEAFIDPRSTRCIIDFIKMMLEKEEILSKEECITISNCLLLLRNILHIPETRVNQSSTNHTSVQNQILWNLFTQNIDKILIQLITCTHKAHWGITMAQLISVMYKDQHVGTLQNLLNLWFEASLSESSEDNESNTSPPDQGGEDSSPMVTSDPTSDSSDNGGFSNDNDHGNHSTKIDLKLIGMDQTTTKQYLPRKTPLCEPNKNNRKPPCDGQRKTQPAARQNRKQNSAKSFTKKKHRNDSDDGLTYHNNPDQMVTNSHGQPSGSNWSTDSSRSQKKECPSASELSDYGYGTQVENQGSVSTSSNDDDSPQLKRPVHQKLLTIQKMRYASKPVSLIQMDQKEWRRKKLVKRSRTNTMNMKALLHHTPTDEDISNLLKEFTVDFMLKGYGFLMQELHVKLLAEKQTIELDTSHFFWLITYFLKFASQLELELEHISPVLSFEILSYLTYEGVNLCEQLEICSQQQDIDVRPFLRRLHLLVTALREFVQAVETYRKISHLSPEDRQFLLQLQLKIAATEDLRSLFILLLRHYNPILQDKQYLKDLILTNHTLMLFVDYTSKLPQYKGNSNMMEHIKQFATVEMMHQYGIALEDFQSNGEFINKCIFTMMHHIAGDLEKATVLIQPNILKSFSKICDSDFYVSDVWSDLIEYVIHKFVDVPKQSSLSSPVAVEHNGEITNFRHKTNVDTSWSKDDKDNLYWYYVQSARTSDPFGRMKQLYYDSGSVNKTKTGIIHQLFAQDIITEKQYENFMRAEEGISIDQLPGPPHCRNNDIVAMDSVTDNFVVDSWVPAETDKKISALRDQLIKENKGGILQWLQKILLEVCYVKLQAENLNVSEKKFIMEPVAYHYAMTNQSIPVVAWNLEQRNIMSYKPFVLLLHKLGFHLPADSGKIFIRIPDFWTADVIFSIAQKLMPIEKTMLKFDENLLKNNNFTSKPNDNDVYAPVISNQRNFAFPYVPQSSSTIRFTPQPMSANDWMKIVMHSKTIALPQRPPSLHEDSVISQIQHTTDDVSIPAALDQSTQIESESVPDDLKVCSLSEMEAESVASELTRMCVSDEEDKQDHIQLLPIASKNLHAE